MHIIAYNCSLPFFLFNSFLFLIFIINLISFLLYYLTFSRSFQERQQYEMPDDKSYLSSITLPKKPTNDTNGWFVNNNNPITNCFENMDRDGDSSFMGKDARQVRGGASASVDRDEVLSPFSYRGGVGSTSDTPQLRPPSSLAPYPPAWLTAPIGTSTTAIGRSVSHDSARKDSSPPFGSTGI